MERVATLSEIETHWGIMDVVSANEALDAWHEAEADAQAEAEKA
jgi:hypothetical protein